MKFKELKDLQKAELDKKLKEMQLELMKLGGQVATGSPPKNTAKIRNLKKDIARIHTEVKLREVNEMDDELWDKFGLPKELNVGDTIAKEDQRITVKIIKKKFGKKYTVIEGIDGKEVDIKDITKKLKAKFACGGTFRERMIELQGDHKDKIKQALTALGFPEESITV